MTFTLFELLIIIGISQGLITSVLLLTTQDKQMSQRILGVTVFVFCLANCRVLLHSSGLYHTLNFMYFPVGMELLLPPLVYIYVLSLTKTDFKIKPQYFWHFIPGLLYAIYDILLYILALSQGSIQEKQQLGDILYFNELNNIEDYLIIFITFFYVILGYKNISAYMKWLKQFKDYKTFPIYGWLKSLIFYSALLGLVLLINQFMFAFSMAMDFNTFRWRSFNLLLAFVTYYIGFMGYKKDGLKVHVTQSKLVSKAKKLNSNNYLRVENNLMQLLEKDKIYLDSLITLKQLATELEVTPESLSLIINQRFEMGFRDIINSYRVKRVKKMLSDSQKNNLSILDIALDSGFNSQASFYRAFKKFEGLSPKAFRAQFSL